MGRKKVINYHKNSEDLLNLLNNSGLGKKKFTEIIGVSRKTLDNWIAQGGVTFENWLNILDKMQPYVELNTQDQTSNKVQNLSTERFLEYQEEIDAIKAVAKLDINKKDRNSLMKTILENMLAKVNIAIEKGFDLDASKKRIEESLEQKEE